MIPKRCRAFRDPTPVESAAGRDSECAVGRSGLLCPAGASSATLRRRDEAPAAIRGDGKLSRLGGFAVSPDGGRVAYALGVPDVDANATRSPIWMRPGRRRGRAAPADRRRGGRRSELLAGRAAPGVPLRPRGRQTRSGSWTCPGERRSRATSFPTGVNAFTWTPDGASFLISSDVFPECADTACLERMVKARAVGEGQGARRGAPPLPPLGQLEGRDAVPHLAGARRRLGRSGRGSDAGGPRRAELRGRRRSGLERLARRQGARLSLQPRQGWRPSRPTPTSSSCRSPA